MAAHANNYYPLARGKRTTGESAIRTRLYGKLAYRCKLIRPLPVLGMRDTDQQYIVHDEHMYNYGVGPTKGEALAEYKRMLAADFLILSKYGVHLAPSLQPELQYLQQFVRRY